MDYEKLYNEALERAKTYFHSDGNYNDYTDKMLLEIFPELRESEDEKIKRCVSDVVRKYGVEFSTGAITKEKMLSWLEKHTPKYKVGDCIKYRREKYKITNVTATDNNFYYNVSLIKEPSDWGEVVAAIGMAAEEKMFKIEQESTWSEEDERIRNEIIDYLKGFIPHHKDDLVAKSKVWISWLEKQKITNEDAEQEKNNFVSGKFLYCRASFNEFKEGESYWFEYIGNDNYIGRSDNVLNQQFHITPRLLYTWFIEQHPYVEEEEQKDVEWSDEDEKMLKNTIDSMYVALGVYERERDTLVYKQIEKEINWLKSIKSKLQ